MAFAVKARLTGVEQALRNLGAMTRTVRNTILRKAVNASSRLVLDAARALVPQGTGMLKRSLAVRIQTYRGSGAVVAVIGPRTGYQKTRQGKKQTAFGRKIKDSGQDPSKYAHLVEFGRASVQVKKARVLSDGATFYGRVVQSVPPRPFLRPAYEREKARVIATMYQLIAEELNKAAKALGGKK